MRRVFPWALSSFLPALPALAVLAVLAALAGCHRGGDWEPVEPLSAPDTAAQVEQVELLVLGQPRAKRATSAVAHELQRTLAAAHSAGRPALVAWLGTDFGRAGPDRASPCPRPAEAYSSAPLAELERVLSEARTHGATVWGLPGPDGLRCGLTSPTTTSPAPYTQPDLSYVLRVHRSGEVELASHCAGSVCELIEPAANAEILVELVFAELSAWHYPGLLDADADAQLAAQQRSLLAALARAPACPRILLSSIPLDSAGAHGLGGRLQRTGYRYLPESFREAIAAGLFVGTIGALERGLQISADQSNAIHRSQRTLIAAPVFGVVSGAAGGAGHSSTTSRADALFPELEAEAAGFVRLLIGPEHVHIEARARIAGRWRQASIELPLQPEPHGPLHSSPIIQPCPGCDPLGGAADGDTFVPRPPRPR